MQNNVDCLGQKVDIGDYVAYAPAGAYSGISIGKVVKFTSKNFGISKIKNGGGNGMGYGDRLYYSTDVIKIDSVLVE